MSRVPDPPPASDGDNLLPYAGRWVALVGSRVIGQGGTSEQAMRAAKAARPKETPTVVFVSPSTPLLSSEIIEKVAAALPHDVPVYLVGGAVRDSMLGKRVHDLDFVLPGEVLKYARQVAKTIQAAFYPLDEERDTARLIWMDGAGQRHTLDFTAFRGLDLESDLLGRDFTVNAMAVDLRSTQALFDPLGGASDLRAKILRACSPSTFQDDPLRIIRAVRLAAAFDFHILPETRSLMRKSISGLSDVSPERTRDELFKIFSGPQPSTSILALDMLGATPYFLPELAELKGVEQSAPHIYPVWEHSLGVMRQLESVLQALRPEYDQDAAANMLMALVVMRLGRYREQIQKHFQAHLTPERSVRGLLFFAALYHDIGKPHTKQVEPDGRIRFFTHDQVGEELVAVRARRLRLSNSETDRVRKIVRHHLRPILLAQNQVTLTRRAIYRFFKDTGSAGVEICLLSMADVLATYGPNITSEHWAKHLDIVRSLLEAWWENPQDSVSPPAIVDGHELMDSLRIPPGPVVGRLLEAIRENQAMGKIHTQEEALALAKDLFGEWKGSQ
jgi:putative nucleotidyltransferase with HDIG domain